MKDILINEMEDKDRTLESLVKLVDEICRINKIERVFPMKFMDKATGFTWEFE